MKFFLLLLFLPVIGCATYEAPKVSYDAVRNSENHFKSFPKKAFPSEHLQLLEKENFDLQRSRFNLKKLGLLYEQQFGAQLPQIGLGFDAVRNKTEFLAFQGTAVQNALRIENYSSSVNGSFDLDPFGVLRSNKAQAKNNADAAAFNDMALRLTQKANYVKNFHNLYFAQQDIAIAKENADIAKKNMTLVDFRYNAGLLPLSNLLSAKQNYEAAKTLVENKKQVLLLAESAYALLLGQGRLDMNKKQIAFADIPSFSMEDDFETISLTHIDNRPDVMAARKTLEAAYDGADASLGRMFPSVALTISYSNIATEFSKAFTKQNLASNFAASLAQVLFDGGRLYAGLKISETDAEIAKVNYKEVVVNAINQTENSIKLFKQAQNILDANQKNFISAQQNLKIATEAYNNGRMTLIEYFDIQSRYYTAKTTLLTAKRDIRDRYTDMLVQLNIQPIEGEA